MEIPENLLNKLSFPDFEVEKMVFDKSLNDYHIYNEQKNRASEKSFFLSDSIDFSLGVRTGITKGTIESGKELLSFAANAITHPIDATYGIYEAFSNLAKLACSQEWRALSKAVAPEICTLVNEWKNLSAKEKGAKSGYILGKYGTDIFLPGAAAKVISKGIKGAKELAVIAKNLQKTEQLIVMEALAGSGGNSGSFARIYKSNLTKNYLKEYANNVITRNISRNIEFTKHALERAVERNISKEAIFEALNNPLKIEKIKIDNLGRHSQRFIGKKAEVVINPESNQIVSVNPTSTRKVNKLIKGLSNDQN